MERGKRRKTLTFFKTLIFGFCFLVLEKGGRKDFEWGTADSEAGQLTENLCSFPVLDAVPRQRIGLSFNTSEHVLSLGSFSD